MAQQNLTQEELDERIAILRRFRTLLEQQRNKFREYLEVLEKQQTAIEEGNTDILVAHAELEQQIVNNIGSLQKVISPLEKLYQTKTASSPEHGGELSSEAFQIPELKTDLAKLQQEVLLRNSRNQELLRESMAEMKTRMNSFRNPYKASRSVYADRGTATMINIQS